MKPDTAKSAAPKASEPRRPLWRRLLSAARAQGEQALHAGRRRRARARLQSFGNPKSFLFVCEGNIFRSPFAAGCFETASATRGLSGLRARSAGFVGPGRPAPAEAQQLAARFGIVMSEHRSQMINGPLLAESDLIVVMEARQARALAGRYGVAPGRILLLGDLDPQEIERRSIADPWNASHQVLEGSYARVARCVSELADVAASYWTPAAVAPVESVAPEA